jgi:hypothetical protein
MHTGLRQGTVKERGVDWWVILEEMLEKYNKREWTGILIIFN